MRKIEVDMRCYLIPGTYIWLNIIEAGWVPFIVFENTETLIVDHIFEKKRIYFTN